ncbi:TcfC E-set like domain-containing protein [Microbulbifer sp. 2201CG32-9]|uniref:TcfC E-set like domain-containing protein n=1 Tax=Microbulbifer sp. 2201CG32-9 TaxID=3232309 RepID=UPI00345C04C0
MNRATRQILLAVVLVTLGNKGLAASEAFMVSTGVPEGFADLTETQRLVADLYYGGRAIGSAMVEVDPYTLRFSDPNTVLQLLPPTLYPERVLELLREAQARNSHRVCYSPQQRDCGVVVPEHLALIYDASRFRVDLFLAPELLPQKAAIENPFLPDSTSDVSLVQGLTATWSGVRVGDLEDARSISLFGQSILSFGESALYGQWSATDGGDSQVAQLYWGRDYRGRAYSAGLIQPRGDFSSFAASPYLYGVEYLSSNNSRTDDRYRQGTLLDINMPVRGRVEIHRDNRLLYSELLEAGNRLLDTSALPGGSYEVEIRSFDEFGRPLARYRQFFSKDSLLPPPGEWRWSVQAGRPAQGLRDGLLPQPQDDYFFQVGAARRLFDDTGLFASVAVMGEQSLFEIGGRWVGEFLELSPSLVRGDDGRNGHRLLAQLNTSLFNFSVAETRLQSGSGESLGREFSLLGPGYRQRNAQVSGFLAGGRVSLRYAQRSRGTFLEPQVIFDSEIGGANRLTTLEYRRDFFRSRRWQGEMTLTHSDADGQYFTGAAFEFRFRGDHWSHTTRARTNSDRVGGQQNRVGFRSSWRDGDRWALEMEQQFSGETGSEGYRLGSHTRIAGRRGQLSSTLDYRAGGSRDSLNYLGSLSTSFIATGDAFAWGGESATNSAVLVSIAGSDDQPFEVLVDGLRRGYARGGGRSVINLPSFRSYDIQLRPMAGGFHDYREMQDRITLYPGNVAVAAYRVIPVTLVLGRLIRAGKPAANTEITLAGSSAVTDEFGVFQIEIHRDPQSIRSMEISWEKCLAPVREHTSGKHWLNLGDIDWDKANCEHTQKHYVRH